MANNIFIPLKEACRRYGKEKRTLIKWAREGALLYTVINATSHQPVWMIESPEAHYERMAGIV